MAYATASVRAPDAFNGAAGASNKPLTDGVSDAARLLGVRVRGASNKPPLVPLAHSVPVAAELLGVGVSKVWEMVRAGEISAVRLGRRTVITQREIERKLGLSA